MARKVGYGWSAVLIAAAALLAGAAAQVRADVVLMDEYWTPEIMNNDVKVTEVDTQATGDPTMAMAGYFSVKLENQTGAPNARMGSAACLTHTDLLADQTEARLWYRTDKWNGKWELGIWVMPQSGPAPVQWLAADLDGGGPDGRLIADDRWHQAKGILKKGNDYDKTPKDELYRPCWVWLAPKEGWDIAHTTYVDRIEAVVVSGPDKGKPMPAPAVRVRSVPGAQTTGPGWIWWEGEDSVNAAPLPTYALVPRSAEAQKLLSNGTWAQGAGNQEHFPYKAADDAEPLRYKVNVADAGSYALWARVYCNKAAFRWRWDGGEWHNAAPSYDTMNGVVMLLGNWLPIGWASLGQVDLTAGTHTFEVQTVQMPNRVSLGFDCFVLAKGAFVPPASAAPAPSAPATPAATK